MTDEYIKSELSNFNNPYYHNNDMMAFYNLKKIIKYYHSLGKTVTEINSLLLENGLIVSEDADLEGVILKILPEVAPQ